MARPRPIKNSIDELFVLSDGVPTKSITNTEQILELVRDVNRYQKIRIHAVFAGTGKGAELLRRLTEENDGVFVTSHGAPAGRR